MTTVLQGLAPAQRDRFEARGLVRLEGLIPRKTAERLAEVLWRDMAQRHHIHRRDPRSWRPERPTDFKPLRKADAFRAMATPGLRAMLDDLLGRGDWLEPDAWGQPLVCFPSQHRWDVPHQNWHLDLPADPRRFRQLMGRLFLLIAPLRPRGGGTLVAAGSHRLVWDLAEAGGDRLHSSAIRNRLKSEHRWFAELMSPTRDIDRIERFMARPTDVRGVAMQVEEITGEPGDVWLMHPAALHTLSVNNRETPRLALAQSIFPKTYFA
jgi:hypothetical protein